MNKERDKFILFCDSLNNKCISLQQKEKEYISDDVAFEAYVYISLMKLEFAGDFLLFLSAINLLNTYVKQDGSKLGYIFKKEIDYFLEACIRNNDEFLKINKDNDKKGNLLLVQINSIQFSFHSVKCSYDGINQILKDDLEWDGIKKQMCAVTIFEECKNNNLLRSNKTFRGANLKDKVNRFVSNYKKGVITFDTKF